MEDENWVDQMHDKYLHLFETYEGEDSENSYYKKGQILRGIEVAGHWKQPIEDFLKELERILSNDTYIVNPLYDNKLSLEENEKLGNGNPCIPNPEGNRIQIFQIKEKFGEIRIYVESNNPRMGSAIDRSVARCETRCSMICSNCGKLQYKLKSTGRWVRYVCDDCLDIA